MTERNYHIFYQLCAGAPLKERKDLGLDTDTSKFHYLKQGGPAAATINGVDDAEEFRTTQTALSTIGIGIEKQWAVKAVEQAQVSNRPRQRLIWWT